MILGAGRGQRLQPLTNKIPKPLVHIADMTLIEHLVLSLDRLGIEHITVGLGWKSNLIQEHLSTLPMSDIIHPVNVANYEYGPIQTLMTCFTALEDDSPLLIMPADFVVDEAILSSIIKSHTCNESQCIATIGVDKSATTGATVHVINDLVTGMNLSDPDTIVGRCAMVLAVNRDFEKYCEIAMSAGDTRVSGAINRMIAYDEIVEPEYVVGTWLDIDTFEDILKANKFLLHKPGLHSPECVYVPDGDVIEIGDRMTLTAGIVVEPGVQLRGPLLISHRCRISTGSIIGPFVSLGPNTSIGEECSLSNCVLFGSADIAANRTLDGFIVYNREILR